MIDYEHAKNVLYTVFLKYDKNWYNKVRAKLNKNKANELSEVLFNQSKSQFSIIMELYDTYMVSQDNLITTESCKIFNKIAKLPLLDQEQFHETMAELRVIRYFCRKAPKIIEIEPGKIEGKKNPELRIIYENQELFIEATRTHLEGIKCANQLNKELINIVRDKPTYSNIGFGVVVPATLKAEEKDRIREKTLRILRRRPLPTERQNYHIPLSSGDDAIVWISPFQQNSGKIALELNSGITFEIPNNTGVEIRDPLVYESQIVRPDKNLLLQAIAKKMRKCISQKKKKIPNNSPWILVFDLSSHI